MVLLEVGYRIPGKWGSVLRAEGDGSGYVGRSYGLVCGHYESFRGF